MTYNTFVRCRRFALGSKQLDLAFFLSLLRLLYFIYFWGLFSHLDSFSLFCINFLRRFFELPALFTPVFLFVYFLSWMYESNSALLISLSASDLEVREILAAIKIPSCEACLTLSSFANNLFCWAKLQTVRHQLRLLPTSWKIQEHAATLVGKRQFSTLTQRNYKVQELPKIPEFLPGTVWYVYFC